MANIEIGKPLFNTNYIVDEGPIGAGADGKVYVVHDKTNVHIKYAAKVITKPEDTADDYWSRYGDEAVTSIRVSKGDNPNIVKTHQILVEGNTLVFIQDYIRGITLKEYLAEHKCIIPRKALHVFLKILNGVDHLHHFKHKIIHRDLKPENIMVTEDLSSVVILDFGVSSVITLDENNKVKLVTADQQIRGTFPYISPDNLSNWKENLSVQSDFYALGVILYEMIMGEVPFAKVENQDGSIDHTKTLKLPLQYDIPNISQNPSIPVALENIIFRCMASKKEDLQFRYASCSEIIQDTKKCLLLINKRDEDVALLKPINKRNYQKAFKFNIDKTKTDIKWYKKWWFMLTMSLFTLAVIVVCIVFLFFI